MQTSKRGIAVSVLFLTLFLASILVINIFPTQAAVNEDAYTGWLTIIWGDAPNGDVAETTEYILHHPDEGNIKLTLGENEEILSGLLLALDRQQITVQGKTQLSSQSEQKTLEITAIVPVNLQADDLEATAVTGAQPFVSIMCKFADISAEPETWTYFQNMYASSYPGLNHYWQEVSYNTANINGSAAYGWYTLPRTRSYYVYDIDGDGYVDLDHHRAAVDCTNIANAYINFANVKGINLMFNYELDGYAWGGGDYLTLDGVTKVWSMTWEPPWGYRDITVISHEMGHAFGLPHSSGTYGQTYDNEWDVMSDTWSNCGNSSHITYGCLGQHTISYHKDKLGWIPANQKYTVNQYTYASLTLEQLALPQTSNYKMVQIPIGGSSTKFYTVEVRRKIGYDVKLPGQAVIIHEVDLGRSRPANVIDSDGNGDTGDAGAMWTVGETFTDTTNNIKISITAATATGFNLTISNATVPPPNNFRVTGSGQYSIALAWDDGTSETGYKIYREESASFVQIATVGANITTYVDEDVNCNASYRYKLSAYTASGESESTNAITGTTLSSCPPPPDNDDFDYAENITLPSTTNSFSTREATEHLDDPDIPQCNINNGGRATVWYFYEATSDTAISLDTKAADYDTFIAVWTGSRQNLNLVACNDDTGGTKQSQVAIRVSNGEVYYIEIGQP